MSERRRLKWQHTSAEGTRTRQQTAEQADSEQFFLSALNLGAYLLIELSYYDETIGSGPRAAAGGDRNSSLESRRSRNASQRLPVRERFSELIYVEENVI